MLFIQTESYPFISSLYSL